MVIKYHSTIIDNVPASEYHVAGKFVRKFVTFHNSLVGNTFDSKFLEFIVHENYSYVGEHLRCDFYSAFSCHFPDYDVRFTVEDDLITGALISYYPF